MVLGMLGAAQADAHVVIEQAVEADVSEPQFLAALPQMCLPVGAQSKRGVTAADAQLVVMPERCGRLSQIYAEPRAALSHGGAL